MFTKCVGVLCGSPGALQHCAETVQTLCDRKVDAINVVANENHITDLLIKLQGGSNMTGTDLYVNKLLRSAACLHTNQSRSYFNHLVHSW